jgi:hypothetical protein
MNDNRIVIDEYHEQPQHATSGTKVKMPCHEVNNLINLHLEHLTRQRQNVSSKSQIASIKEQEEKKYLFDESLRVADFLYGNTARIGHRQSSSSCLMNDAMQILDQCCYSKENDLLSNAPLYQSTKSKKYRRNSNSHDTISRMRSPSGRSLYLVAKGAKASALVSVQPMLDDMDTSSTADHYDMSSHYLCCIPDEAPIRDETSCNARAASLQPYCSCQSFLESNQLKQTQLLVGCFNRAPLVLCKHLLALTLLQMFGTGFGVVAQDAPHSEFSIPTMDFATEEDYSRAIIQRLFN